MFKSVWFLTVGIVTVTERSLPLLSRISICISKKTSPCGLHIIFSIDQGGLSLIGVTLWGIIDWAHLWVWIVIRLDCFEGCFFDVKWEVDSIGVEVAVDEFSSVSEVPVLQAEWGRCTYRVPCKTGTGAWSAGTMCGCSPVTPPTPALAASDSSHCWSRHLALHPLITPRCCGSPVLATPVPRPIESRSSSTGRLDICPTCLEESRSRQTWPVARRGPVGGWAVQWGRRGCRGTVQKPSTASLYVRLPPMPSVRWGEFDQSARHHEGVRDLWGKLEVGRRLCRCGY